MNPVRPSSFPKPMGGPMSVPPPRALPNNSRKLFQQTSYHFANILRYIHTMQEESQPDGNAPVFEDGFQSKGGRWIELDVPHYDPSSVNE
jgi:hypothetical protein